MSTLLNSCLVLSGLLALRSRRSVSAALALVIAWCAAIGIADARTPSTDAFLDSRSRQIESILERDLPIDARRVMNAIRQGGPFAYPKDGIVFFNREKLLPYRPRGYYTEYTVRTPGVRNRGARRIVAGGDARSSGIYYYTEDHYQSFKQIRE